MQKRLMILTLATAVAAAMALGVGAVVSGATTPTMGPPAIADPTVPQVARQLGIGERLILVTAGRFSSEAAAQQRNGAYSFGEMQGFYPVVVSQFRGLDESLGGEGPWALASAFRTREAAVTFAIMAAQAGADPFVTKRVSSWPGAFAGLGQEASPEGTGPLAGPIPASAPAPMAGPLARASVAATATEHIASPASGACLDGAKAPPGFRRSQDQELTAPGLGVSRATFRDLAGRRLHVTSGVSGDFGEALPVQATVRMADGSAGYLRGILGGDAWVIIGEVAGACAPRTITGLGFGRDGFMEAALATGLVVRE